MQNQTTYSNTIALPAERYTHSASNWDISCVSTLQLILKEYDCLHALINFINFRSKSGEPINY